jgi:ABC-type dipeptide/oligopeptide/nickel transport system permease component
LLLSLAGLVTCITLAHLLDRIGSGFGIALLGVPVFFGAIMFAVVAFYFGLRVLVTG